MLCVSQCGGGGNSGYWLIFCAVEVMVFGGGGGAVEAAVGLEVKLFVGMVFLT